MTERTALYCCPGSCGKIHRGPWKEHHAYGCLCDALPLGSERDRYRYVFGPQRPYYPEREHRMIQMEDDGREVDSDLRDGPWYA